MRPGSNVISTPSVTVPSATPSMRSLPHAANGWNDLRHHVAHIQVIHLTTLLVSVGSGWRPTPSRCGPSTSTSATSPSRSWASHAGWQYPFASLIRNGAQLAIGSDWSVSTADPWKILEVAVRRIDPGIVKPTLSPRRAARSPRCALTAATAGSAWVNHLDRVTGTIEPGKLADLVVADRDPFEALEAIGDTRTAATLIEGELVAGSL